MTNHNQDDLIIDLPHLDRVREKVEELAKGGKLEIVEKVDQSDRSLSLGLGRLHVKYAVGSEIDSGIKLLSILRKTFRAEDGWTPTLDIDATLEHVGSATHNVGETSFIQGGTVTPTSFIQGGGSGFPKNETDVEKPLVRADPSRGEEIGERVRIAVIDTPIYPNTQLSGSWLARQSAILQSGDHRYLAGHATFVVGLIHDQAPNASIELHHVLGGKDDTATAWDVAGKIAELAHSGLDIVNLSLGCFTTNNKPPLLLRRAIGLVTPQTVVVAAAGNYGSMKPDDGRIPVPRPFWPAALDDVVAVGADEEYRTAASFSPTYPWVDAYAPGVDVTSTFLCGKVNFPADPAHRAGGETKGWPSSPKEFTGLAQWSGTSFAAATASGVIARYTIPGVRSAREALRQLLDNPSKGGNYFRPR